MATTQQEMNETVLRKAFEKYRQNRDRIQLGADYSGLSKSTVKKYFTQFETEENT
jgi:hypothetical protein